MRNLLALMAAVLAGLVACASQAEGPVPATKQTSSRYVYCNVYLTDLCFGIASGDALEMRIPADFVLRTVSLLNGANVLIYEGNHPKDALPSAASKRCPAGGNVYQCKFATSSGEYNVLYQASADSQMIQMRITGITPTNQAGVTDFLSGFHRCKATGQSEQCTDERPFVGIN